MNSKAATNALQLILICGCVLCFQSGCKKKNSLVDIYNSNIKKAYVCYTIYQEGHGYQGPKDEQEFKTFLTTDPTALHLLKRINLEPANLDQVFVSERDGEPFVIRYGLKGVNEQAIVFEKTGVDGKRFVALVNPVELETADYDAYLSGKKTVTVARLWTH